MRDLPDKELAAYYDTGYEFNAQSARNFEEEVWHAAERSSTDKKGNYVLEVPYVHANELVMDVLRHGPDVEVLGPRIYEKRCGNGFVE